MGPYEKQLNLNWSSPKAVWWPHHIPYKNIWSPPQGFEGRWSVALQEVIKSCYQYHKLHAETYVNDG